MEEDVIPASSWQRYPGGRMAPLTDKAIKQAKPNEKRFCLYAK